jgi:hypothetical protein
MDLAPTHSGTLELKVLFESWIFCLNMYLHLLLSDIPLTGHEY